MQARNISSVGPHQLGTIEKKRRQHLFEHIDLAGRGLEIGPYDQPTVFKSEADILYLDRQSIDDLVTACPDPALAAKIPEVDILAATNNYREAVDLTFDYIIANHVLEHVPNTIGWLVTVSAMLNPAGVLFMALPDKKYTFDKFRPDTPFSHILTEYLGGVSESPLEHLIEIEIYYDLSFVGKRMDVKDRLNIDRLRSFIDSKPHLGLHCHVFQSETFLPKIMKPILFMGIVDFNIVALHESADNYGEFHIVLKKGTPEVTLTEAEFYTKDFALPAAGDSTGAGMEGMPKVLEVQVKRQAAAIAQLEQQLQACEAAIAELQGSRSWRLTIPVRKATTRLRAWRNRLIG